MILNRFIFIILSIILLIDHASGQNVTEPAPIEQCSKTTATVRCPSNTTIVVKRAFHGISKSANCYYTEGDCTSDFTQTTTCTTDQSTCLILGSATYLQQCSGTSNYFRVEYDCVPTSMNDLTKEYVMCQDSSEIRSTNGIIRSLGYPSPNITRVECIRSINIPSDKSLNVWLSDINMRNVIGCPNDYVIVTDSLETVRTCSPRRIKYPTLCQPQAIIQYKLTTQSILYRGMRIYFELVDRLPDDGCSSTNSSVTPVPVSTSTITTIDPLTTTTPPPYAIQGISSNVISFTLCPTSSITVTCPDNYGIAIIQSLSGINKNNQCDSSDVNTDCKEPNEELNICKKTCTFSYGPRSPLPACANRLSNYRYIEYQCIPTRAPIIQNVGPCPVDGSPLSIYLNESNRFHNYNYPTFSKGICSYRLTTKPGNIIRVYSLDINMNDRDDLCSENKLILREDGEITPVEICNEPRYSSIYVSCSNQMDLIYSVTNDTRSSSSGVDLYIESVPRPSDWTCGKNLLTTAGTSTTTTVTTTTKITTGSLETETTRSSDMAAQPLVEHDICPGKDLNYRCPSGYTFMIVNAFYGIQKTPSNPCRFTAGDSTEDVTSSITACATDDPGCRLVFNTTLQSLTSLGRSPDFLHVVSQCVPSKPTTNSSSLSVTDICYNDDDIMSFAGIINSPQFPFYQQTNIECKREVITRSDAELLIWINQMSIADGGLRKETEPEEISEPDLVIDTRNLNEADESDRITTSVRAACSQDYLIISAAQVNYVYCGKKKQALKPICGGRFTIRYKTVAKGLTAYRGFKLYFETVERAISVDCAPISFSTTPAFEIYEPWAQNLQTSGVLSQRICAGSVSQLRCSRQDDYALSIIDARYIVTGTGSCEATSVNECVESTSIDVPCEKSCFVPFDIPKNVQKCGNQTANVLEIHYECIPTRLPNNQNPIDICQSTLSPLITVNRGIIVSPKYPELQGPYSCKRTLQTSLSQLWQIFIIDLSIDDKDDLDQCSQSSLTFNDKNQVISLCGSLSPRMIRVTCGNLADIQFVTSGNMTGYRGFKIYFESFLKPDNWPCSLYGNLTTIRTSPTTRGPTTTTLLPPSQQIIAFGGTTGTDREYCSFPFIYDGQPYRQCLEVDPPTSPPSTLKQPWCSTTSDFDTDGKWGFCDLGVTEETSYTICRNEKQTLTCPENYVIDILSADYGAKVDGNTRNDSCTYDRGDCFKRDPLTVQVLCAGKRTCVVTHYSQTLPACQRYQSVYLYVVYTCVPNTINAIPTFNMCDDTVTIDNDTQRGYIVSPNYPSTTKPLDCTFTIPNTKPNQNIDLYILDLNLNAPVLLTQVCTKDVLKVTSSSEERQLCGTSPTDLVMKVCRSSLTLQLTRSADANGKGFKLYFQYSPRASTDICPEPITTPVPMTTISTVETTTLTTQKPLCYPYPCLKAFKTLCYPDITGLFNAKNFQCPSSYKLVIHQALYGVSSTCQYDPFDCVAEADNIYRLCAGKESCSVPFYAPVNLPNCGNSRARYLFIEYQCLPSNNGVELVDELCSSTSGLTQAVSGILTSKSYPSYVASQCVNATVRSPDGTDFIVIFYLLNMNLVQQDLTNDACSDDYLILNYQCRGQWYDTGVLCGSRTTEVLFQTCLPSDQFFITYRISGQTSLDQGGFSLLYHFVPYVPSSLTTQITTTTTSQTTSLIPGPGPTSTPLISSVDGVGTLKTIKCDTSGYVLIIHKVLLYTSTTSSGPFSADECYEDRTKNYNTCGAKSSCSIFPPSIKIPTCNNTASKYLYTEYQCIPSRPKFNLDICSASPVQQLIQGGARIFSLNYASQSQECKISLKSTSLISRGNNRAFKVFIVSLNLPMQRTLREAGSQCRVTDPRIEINDQAFGVTTLCGSSHGRYVFETCSTDVEIQFLNYPVSQMTGRFTGFEIYLESIERKSCPAPVGVINRTSTFTVASKTACAQVSGRERVDFGCFPGDTLTFLQSHEFVTKPPGTCDVNQAACHFPSEQPQAQCAGEETCSFVYNFDDGYQNGPCQNMKPDTIQFYYQCLPSSPRPDTERYTFCSNSVVNALSGFIETPNFPYSYEGTAKDCTMDIVLPSDPDSIMNKFSIYLYIVEMSLRDVEDKTDSGVDGCVDSITYTSGSITKSLCGSIDQTVFEFASNQKNVTLRLNMLSTQLGNDTRPWKGARLFFGISRLDLPVPPPPVHPATIPTTTTSSTVTTHTLSTTKNLPTTPDNTGTSKAPMTTQSSGATDTPDDSKNNTGMIVGIVIAVIVVVIIVIGGFILYRRRTQNPSGSTPVAFNTATEEIHRTADIQVNNRGGSIGSSQLKKPVTSIMNPFFGSSTSTTGQKESDA